MKQNRNRERREKLSRHQKGLCYFCKIRMTAPNTGPTGVTLFHFDDRYSDERGRHNGFIRTCAACYECATFISQKRTRDRPLEELHKRAGRHSDGDDVGYYVTEKAGELRTREKTAE